jgi:hypothetical protein
MREWRYSSTVLGLGTRYGLVVSFTPLPLYPCTHSIGGWVDPGVSLNAMENKKILLCREMKAGPPARSPSLYHLSVADFISE